MPAATRRSHGCDEEENRDRAQGAGAEDSENDRAEIGNAEAQTLRACPRSVQRPPIGGLFHLEVMMDAAAAGTPVIVAPRRTHVAHAWLTAFPFAELQAEADRRRLHPDALAAKILEKVLCRGLVDELLDL